MFVKLIFKKGGLFMRSGFFEIKMSADAPGTLDIYIYSDVEPDGWDWWTGEYVKSETSANAIREKLEEAGDVENINIYINSLGGSVMEGLAIYNQLKRHEAYKTVYIDGFACSIASVIAMCGDKVIMPRNTLMMVHNAWTFAYGNAAELRKAADDLDVINNAVVSSYLMKSDGKIDAAGLKELLDAETFLTAEECIQYGFADEFAENDADMENAKKEIERVSNSGAGHSAYKKTAERVAARVGATVPTARNAAAEANHPPARDNHGCSDDATHAGDIAHAGDRGRSPLQEDVMFENRAVALFEKYLNIR
jgi:ATP-dependent protease ClpP protease subunit